MKFKKLFFSVFILLVILINFEHAHSSESLLLNSLVDEALKNNPQIQAAKYRYEAAKARVKLLRTLSDPKFEYEYDKITAGMDNLMNNNTKPMRTFAISQEFPFPSKLFLRKQAAQKEANAYEQEYKETERKVIKDVKDAYFQLFLNDNKIRLTQENLNLLLQFIEITNKKYSVNKASQQDSLKAQVEHSKLSNQLVLLEQEKKIARSMLNSLLNRSQEEDIGNIEEASNKVLELDEQVILKSAKESRPELKSFQEMVRKSEIDYSLSKQEYLPDFMIKYKRESNSNPGSWAAMLGVTVPLWFWEKQDSFVKEAQANVGVVKAEYQAQENMVLFEVRSSYARFDAAKKLVKIYETGVLPQAQAALDTARRGYETDLLSFLDLLDSVRTLREFQMEYFESLANLEIALADLERSVGIGLSEVKK
ncbi:MAG: TolC family protein [Candidatus Omnitrophica bacterium]|nr:TolC family protein [Candidatus Omnitrophota bacterium]